MTESEKAKSYDEVQKRVEECYHDGLSMSQSPKEVLEYIFPELKENEDEKIRKDICTLVTGWRNRVNIKGFASMEDMLAWLENQGEQKPSDKVEPKKEDTSELTPFEAELFSMMSDAWQGYQLSEEVNIAEIVKEHSSELLERANKQNPAWSEEDEESCKRIIDLLYCTNSSLLSSIKKNIDWLKSLKGKCLPQPKQEWSEEDESMRIRCIGILGKCYMKQLPDKVEEELDWLKSLKDRVLPQTKTEWSEDDEMIYKHCLVILHDYGYDTWLKSLRPQKQWKPSEEQIRVCKQVYADILSAKGFNIAIVNNELQRLEEELLKAL